jgi:AraC-like DNA-binding protein
VAETRTSGNLSQARAGLFARRITQPVIDELSVSLAHQLYRCMLLWLTRAARPNLAPPTTQEVLYRQLQRELEAQVATRPSVERLAQRLRVSPTTLNRACHAKAGCSAKAVIDLRIALEAQRMLVHSSETSAAIGDLLGFSEPTNFLKFFKRQSGMTPEAFRARHRVG